MANIRLLLDNKDNKIIQELKRYKVKAEGIENYEEGEEEGRGMSAKVADKEEESPTEVKVERMERREQRRSEELEETTGKNTVFGPEL